MQYFLAAVTITARRPAEAETQEGDRLNGLVVILRGNYREADGVTPSSLDQHFSERRN